MFKIRRLLTKPKVERIGLHGESLYFKTRKGIRTVISKESKTVRQ